MESVARSDRKRQRAATADAGAAAGMQDVMLEAARQHHRRMNELGFSIAAWNPGAYKMNDRYLIVMVSPSSVNCEEQAVLLQRYVSPAVLGEVDVARGGKPRDANRDEGSAGQGTGQEPEQEPEQEPKQGLKRARSAATTGGAATAGPSAAAATESVWSSRARESASQSVCVSDLCTSQTRIIEAAMRQYARARTSAVSALPVRVALVQRDEGSAPGESAAVDGGGDGDDGDEDDEDGDGDGDGDGDDDDYDDYGDYGDDDDDGDDMAVSFDVGLSATGVLRLLSLNNKAPEPWTRDVQIAAQSTWPDSPVYYAVHAYADTMTAALDASAGDLLCALRAATVAKMMGVAFSISSSDPTA